MTGNSRKIVILQDRDVHLLRELAVMRVVDREQAKLVGGFGSTTRVNTRLLALAQAGYLRRFFWGTVGGARKALYSLSERGADAAGVPHRRPRRGQNETLAVDSRSAHQLEVNEVYCILKYRPLPDGARFVRWLSFQQPIAGTLIPDGYVEVETAGNLAALFLELDRATEGLSVWRTKVQSYLGYAASGSFAREFGSSQFRTLVITNSESRATALRGATAQLTEKIFRFTTLERIARDTFWGSVWQKTVGQDRLTLI